MTDMTLLAAADATETVGFIRDVIVIAVGLLGFFVLFVFSILAILLYRRISRLTTRAEQAFERLDPAISSLESLGKTLQEFTRVAQEGFGLAGVSRLVGWFFGMGRGRKSE
jgi:hypothetical protein